MARKQKLSTPVEDTPFEEALPGDDKEDATDPQDQDPKITDAQPSDDIPVAPFSSLTVITAVKQCYDEAEQSQRHRKRINERNWDAYHARTSSAGKLPGQSNEFLPRLSMALEQIASFIKKGLVSFGNWFQVDLDPDPILTGSPLTESGVVKLMMHRLMDPDEKVKGSTDFATTIEDGIKTAALSSLLILKIHGVWDICRKYDVEVKNIHNTYTDDVTGLQFADKTPSHRQEDLVLIETKVWKLLVELVNPSSFFIDPTGRGLYEIHRTYKDLYQIVDDANAGLYDKEAVKELARSTYSDVEQIAELERQTDQPHALPPTFRKEVELLEFWGTLLDDEGNVAHRNCRAVVADQQYLILPPEPNPYCHGESPFVYSPLIRVPFTTLHKGLFDQAVAFNLIQNELFNLGVDGALGASWGINLAKTGYILNLREFQGGIPPGSTLILDQNTPPGEKVFENVKTGAVSQETFNMYNIVGQEFNSATLVSDTKLGALPKKTQSASGINAAENASDNFFSSIIFDLEQNLIKPTLRKVWLTMLQNCDDWNADDIAGCIGPEAARLLGSMSPARRFANYAMGAKFKVSGLSTLMSRSQEFQKLSVLQQALMTSPILAQAFMKKYSTDKMLQHLFKAINLDPEDLILTAEEKAGLAQTMQEVGQMSQMLGTQGGQGQLQQQGMPNQQPGDATQQAQAAIASQQQPPQHFA